MTSKIFLFNLFIFVLFNILVRNIYDRRVKLCGPTMCGSSEKASTLLWEEWRVQTAFIWFHHTRCAEGHGVGTTVPVCWLQSWLYFIWCECLLLYTICFAWVYHYVFYCLLACKLQLGTCGEVGSFMLFIGVSRNYF